MVLYEILYRMVNGGSILVKIAIESSGFGLFWVLEKCFQGCVLLSEIYIEFLSFLKIAFIYILKS